MQLPGARSATHTHDVGGGTSSVYRRMERMSECLPLAFSHLGCQEFNSVGTRHWLSCSSRLEKISNPQLCPRCRIYYGCWEAMVLRGVDFLRCLVRSSGSSQQTGRLLFSIQDQNPLTNRGDRDCSPWLATCSLAHSRAVQCCTVDAGQGIFVCMYGNSSYFRQIHLTGINCGPRVVGRN